MSVRLTNAMGTGMLAITLCPELVALVARPADPPPDGTCCAGDPRGRAVGMLPVFGLWARPSQMVVVHSYVLLELLQRVVGSLGETVEAGRVKVASWNMSIGEEGGGGDGVVRGEPVKRVGQHVARCPVGLCKW